MLSEGKKRDGSEIKRSNTGLNSVSIRHEATGGMIAIRHRISTSIRIKITEAAESWLPLTHRRLYGIYATRLRINRYILPMKNINGS